MAAKRKPIECPICHQKMQRITVTHLKKHDMTMDDFRSKYGDIVSTDSDQMVDLSDPDVLSDVSSQIIDYITRDSCLDDIAKQVVHNLMKDQDGRFRIALNLVAVQRINNLTDMYETITDIRSSLLDPRRVAKMSDANRIKLYQVLEKSFESSLNYVKSLSIDKDRKTEHLFSQTSVVNIFENDPNVPDIPGTPKLRGRALSFMDSLIQKLTSEEDNPTVEVDAKVIDTDTIPNMEKSDDKKETD